MGRGVKGAGVRWGNYPHKPVGGHHLFRGVGVIFARVATLCVLLQMLAALHARGISHFFTHQAQAIDLLMQVRELCAPPSHLHTGNLWPTSTALPSANPLPTPHTLICPPCPHLPPPTPQGRHTVVATSTASGKSLCYALPILEALAADPAACALLMFPTKALAQDQLRALRELGGAVFGAAAAPRVEVYDGDTPAADR